MATAPFVKAVARLLCGGLFIELYKLFRSKTIYIRRKTEIAPQLGSIYDIDRLLSSGQLKLETTPAVRWLFVYVLILG
jgi:hypothetical protein